MATNDAHPSMAGEQLGACFGLEQVPRSIHIEKTSIAVTCICCDWQNNGLTAPIPVNDAFLLTLQLRDTEHHDLWTEGQARRTGPLHRGSISIYDLRTSPMVNSVSAFRNMHFYIPRAALNAIAAREGCADVEELPNEPGVGMDDPVLAGLGLALESAFDAPSAITTLFFDHVTSAMASRLVRAYAAGAKDTARTDVLLSAMHESLVKEMLRADLSGNVTMTTLAEACDLSSTEFRHAFLRATGMMPHQWLLAQRVDRARELLQTTCLSLAEIAHSCSFSDTRQMQRIFAVSLGVRPENFRSNPARPDRSRLEA